MPTARLCAETLLPGWSDCWKNRTFAALKYANPVPCGNSQQQNRLQVDPIK